MRLVCPNCEAKYEVPDDAIPDSGRDVQCANCGHAWFQMRPRAAAAAAASAPVEELSAPAEPRPPVEAPMPQIEEVPEPVPVELPDEGPQEAPEEPPVEAPEELPVEAPEEVPVEEPEVEPAPEEDEPPVERAPEAGYKVDDSVLAILREEAEREAKARQSEAVAPKLQVVPPVAAVTAVAVEEAKPAPRRDLLPDVEEINSSLRPSEHPQGDDEASAAMPPPVAQSRGGFRSGFLMVMTLAMIGSGLYIAAPTLSRLVPSLEAPLESYVAVVNSLRLQLDGVMQQATVALNGD